MKVKAGLVSLLLVVAGVTFATPASAAHCGRFGRSCDHAPAVVGGDKYVYSYDPTSGALRRARPRPGQQVTKPGDKRVWEYAYTPACSSNTEPDENGQFHQDVICVAAVDHPQCPPAQFAMWGYRRLVRDALGGVVSQPWQRLPGVACFAPDEEWTREELRQIAENLLGEYLEAHAQRADISIEPEGGSLVNVPVIAHTDELPPIGFAITQPFPGRLDASASYEWSFGEGQVQQGPGNPYTEAISPFEDSGYYIAHAYTRPGTKTITLDTEWAARFTVAGIEIPVEGITFTATATVGVGTARSELVAGDR